MSIIQLQRHHRNTPAAVVNICGVQVYFSYETAVGCNPPGEPSFQRENVWGPTTGRHLNEWGFNTFGVSKLDEAEFTRRMDLAIIKAMANKVAAKVEGA